jgi:hypothetical protein
MSEVSLEDRARSINLRDLGVKLTIDFRNNDEHVVHSTPRFKNTKLRSTQ